MGIKVDKNTPPMERELKYLLIDLCIKWVFCIPQEKFDAISRKKIISAEDFGIEVVEAEGMNSGYETKWVRRISERFIERFGEEQIFEENFVDRIRGIQESW